VHVHAIGERQRKIDGFDCRIGCKLARHPHEVAHDAIGWQR
jgi:hypothetical protein